MAQLMSLLDEHRIANSDADKNPADEFSLDGVPMGNAGDLLAIQEKMNA